MKRLATTIVALGLLLFAAAAPAALRSPQVLVNGGTLQGYLNSQGEAINGPDGPAGRRISAPRAGPLPCALPRRR